MCLQYVISKQRCQSIHSRFLTGSFNQLCIRRAVACSINFSKNDIVPNKTRGSDVSFGLSDTLDAKFNEPVDPGRFDLLRLSSPSTVDAQTSSTATSWVCTASWQGDQALSDQKEVNCPMFRICMSPKNLKKTHTHKKEKKEIIQT